MPPKRGRGSRSGGSQGSDEAKKLHGQAAGVPGRGSPSPQPPSPQPPSPHQQPYEQPLPPPPPYPQGMVAAPSQGTVGGTSGSTSIYSASSSGQSSGQVSSGGASGSAIISLSSSERSSGSFSAPARPGPGTRGDPIKLVANHYAVRIRNMGAMNIFHYDVSISPSITSKGVARAVMREVVLNHQPQLGGTLQQPAKPVFDGSKSLFSARRLFTSDQEFAVSLTDERERGQSAGQAQDVGRERERRFVVKIKEVGSYPMEALVRYFNNQQEHMPQEIIQGLDIALRERPSQKFTPVGRSFFSDTFRNSIFNLGGGIVSWRGFYQSLRPTQNGPSLVVDVSSTAFIAPGNLAEFAETFLKKPRFNERSTLTDGERVKLRKAILRLKISVNHRDSPRRYRITGISREKTKNIRFSLGEGQPETTLVEYFQRTYGYNIFLTDMPSVAVGSRGSYLPLECCEILPGQRYNAKLNDEQVTAMLRSACKKPKERQADIQYLVDMNEYPRDEYAKEFGMEFNMQPTKMIGRVLAPPLLQYSEKKTMQPRFGAWNLLNGFKMVEGAKIENWAIINFANRVNEGLVKDFGEALSKRCDELGLMMARYPVIPPASGDLRRVEDDLRRVVDAARRGIRDKSVLRLLVIVLPAKVPEYLDIKRLCDTVLNVPTQCVLSNHVPKKQSQYLANVAMKINVKAGGTNVKIADSILSHLPALADDPTIIFGADVSHPSPGDDSSPSIAAVVATLDFPRNNQYRCRLSTQAHRQEIIQGLHREQGDPAGDGMFRSLLLNFYNVRKRKPARIVYFRDGVSEGQFYQVLFAELRAMKIACRALDSEYNPKFTIIVVQKRHHTRIFCENPQDGDKSGNCPPGTVVDTAICHPREFDFYLFSHAGLQGTSRPTHYHVIHDENGFSSDRLQLLTNSMSYTYARCTRSVSLVPPAYYADLAAARARCYLDTSSSIGGSEAGSRGPPSTTGSSQVSGPSVRFGPLEVPHLPSVMGVPNDGMFWL